MRACASILRHGSFIRKPIEGGSFVFSEHWHYLGFWFLFSLILALWAVFHIAQNDHTSPLFKALWVVFVLFVPILGFFAWLLFGPRSSRRA